MRRSSTTQSWPLENQKEKLRVKVDVPVLDKVINVNADQYAGMYYNPDKGTIVVQVTNDSKELKDKVTKNIKNKDKVEFEIAKYSKKDYDDAKTKIEAKAAPGSVKALIPDTKNNQLIVIVDKTASKESLKSAVSDSSMLTITEGEFSTHKTAADTTNFGSNIPMGAYITGNYRTESDGLLHWNICTSGFYGINQYNSNVLVTAGHCSPTSSGSVWYQPDNNIPGFGNFSFRTFSSKADGSDKIADAGYIGLYPGFKVTPVVPYPSDTNTTPIVGTYTSTLVGDLVYARGANSGGTTSGTIRYAHVDVWYGIDGYGYNRDETLCQGYTSIGGDSGGPVLTNYRWDNTRGKYVWDLAGINSGVITLKGYTTIADGTYQVYEKIDNIYFDLSLHGIYLTP